MNEWLARAYGTGGGEDVEKIAQAEFAQQMANQEGIDLSGLDENQISELGQDVLGQGQQQMQQPGMQQPGMQQQGDEGGEITPELVQQAQEVLSNPGGFEPDVVQEAQAIMQMVQSQQQPGSVEMAKTAAYRQKEAQEKFEEADFLGRVMAHSFNQEYEKIAAYKQAAGIGGRVAGAVGRGARAVDQGAQRFGQKVVGAVGRTGGGEMKMHPNASRAIGYGTAGLGAAGVGGAGYAAHKHMQKEATVAAINSAAEKLAAEILQANGINPQTLQPIQQQQPTQQQAMPNIVPTGAPGGAIDPQSAAGELVEKRAHQLLNQLGYSIQ